MNEDDKISYILRKTELDYKVVDRMMDCIVLPIRIPNMFKAYNLPPTWIMLWGPRGCGKRTLVNATAFQTKWKLLEFNLTDFDKWGEEPSNFI